MPLSREMYFHFKDELRRSGACRIRIYDVGHRVVVIATDLDEGPSVTNAAEEIATQVVAQFGIDVERLVWVEHYRRLDTRARPGTALGEEYDLVIFEWDGEHFTHPDWTYSNRQEIEELVGEILEEEDRD
jgi:hypothetical protein